MPGRARSCRSLPATASGTRQADLHLLPTTTGEEVEIQPPPTGGGERSTGVSGSLLSSRRRQAARWGSIRSTPSSTRRKAVREAGSAGPFPLDDVSDARGRIRPPPSSGQRRRCAGPGSARPLFFQEATTSGAADPTVAGPPAATAGGQPTMFRAHVGLSFFVS